MRQKNWIGAVLVTLVLAVVPLLVSAHYYLIGLSENAWFSNSEGSYDFFLYWKGQALILLCGMLAFYVAVKQFAVRDEWMGQMDAGYMIFLALYLVLAALSTLCSGHKEFAVWGGYEQWEGMFIIAAYGVVLFMAYLLLRGKSEIRVVTWGLLVGVLILSFLGAMQFFGNDFFRTEQGQYVMNFMSSKKLNFTFNFEKGRVYATLYNPNYVGSYVALLLPVILSLISFRRRVGAVVKSVLAGVTGVFLVIMLFGSQSVTGCIGVFAVLAVFLALFIIRNRKKPALTLGIFGCCMGLAAVCVWLNKPIFEYGWNKIVNPTPNSFAIQTMNTLDGQVALITTGGEKLVLRPSQSGDTCSFEALDEKGQLLQLAESESTDGCFDIQDSRFSEIDILEKKIVAEGKEWDALEIKTPSYGKSYTVVLGDICKVYNPFGKLDVQPDIEAVGFEHNQHFGSRRGYIWSRTFPLLKDHIWIGSGPNTFVYEFPNNDYSGMKNVDYDGSIVTKPHNMYMQIWVQTGALSLLAFLALCVTYLIECIRLYWHSGRYTREEVLGIGIAFGVLGYLVTGLANDSTVAVAPVFWCLLGVGMAVNRLHKTKNGGSNEKVKGAAHSN